MLDEEEQLSLGITTDNYLALATATAIAKGATYQLFIMQVVKALTALVLMPV